MMYCAVLMGLTACNENSIFEGELYKKVVYVLSETDLTFPVTHSLNTPVSVGYITIYAGGTRAIDQDVTVTLEKDPDLISIIMITLTWMRISTRKNWILPDIRLKVILR